MLGRLKLKRGPKPHLRSPIDPLLFEQGGKPLHEAIARFWTSSDPVEYLPCGTTAGSAVAALEKDLSLRLPEDFRSYLISAAPGVPYTDSKFTQWWPPGNVIPVADEQTDGLTLYDHAEGQTYLLFADHMLWCYAWAVCCSNGPDYGKIFLSGSDSDRPVANSFNQFLALAFADDHAIHPGALTRHTSFKRIALRGAIRVFIAVASLFIISSIYHSLSGPD